MLRLLGIDLDHEMHSKGSSALALHGFAMMCMLIDHTYHVFGGPVILNIIGRIAFPIYLFLLVEGFKHTGNVKNYMLRMLGFAIISEIPFDLMLAGKPFYWRHQNVMWTLLICLAMMTVLEKVRTKYGDHGWGFAGLAIMTACVVAEMFCVDYGLTGVLYCVLFYGISSFVEIRWCGRLSMLFGLIGLSSVIYGRPTVEIFSLAVPIQSFCILSLPFIWSYNGEPGSKTKIVKLARYSFYPLHLLFLGLLRLWLT